MPHAGMITVLETRCFFVSGLHHQTHPSLGPCDFVMQQVACHAVPRPTSETKPGSPLHSEVCILHMYLKYF